MLTLCWSSASVAFGMGVDVNVKGVERVIHDDAPHTLEEYVQEMGRAARECNLQGHALLLYHSLKGREDAMKTYCLSQSCLRCQIGKYFEAEASQLPLHNCCCMCRGTSVSSCSCLVCTATKYKLGAVQISASEGHSRDELTDSQKQQLRQQLEEIGANSSKIRFPAGASCPVQITKISRRLSALRTTLTMSSSWSRLFTCGMIIWPKQLLMQ